MVLIKRDNLCWSCNVLRFANTICCCCCQPNEWLLRKGCDKLMETAVARPRTAAVQWKCKWQYIPTTYTLYRLSYFTRAELSKTDEVRRTCPLNHGTRGAPDGDVEWGDGKSFIVSCSSWKEKNRIYISIPYATSRQTEPLSPEDSIARHTIQEPDTALFCSILKLTGEDKNSYFRDGWVQSL